jgi:5-methyltetrahydropteroyltriglutamate--homocysteine methyltransferase
LRSLSRSAQASTGEYLFAVADAMKAEYDAIYQAGLILQLDCPDLAGGWAVGPEIPLAQFRRAAAQRIEALNWATRDIPPERMRLHACWFNYEGPHTTDIPLAEIIDLLLAARPAGLSFEAANPRHGHEWQLWQEQELPDGKILIPGVVDLTTNIIEHPALIAQRLCRFAGIVGAENVIAGTDCGFGTFAGYYPVHPEFVWAKLAAMAQGAEQASMQLRVAAR